MSQNEIRIIDTNGRLRSQGKLSPQIGQKALDAARSGTSVSLSKSQAMRAMIAERRARESGQTVLPVAPEEPGQGQAPAEAPAPAQAQDFKYIDGNRYISKTNKKLVVVIIGIPTEVAIQYVNAAKMDAGQPTEVLALSPNAFEEKFSEASTATPATPA